MLLAITKKAKRMYALVQQMYIVTTNTHTGYFKHAHTMQKHILQHSCNNLILLLWTYEKEVYAFVWDGDEDDIHFFFSFSTMPPSRKA